MRYQINSQRTLRERVADVFNAPFRMFCTLMSSLYCSAMMMVPTLCTNANNNNNNNTGKINTNLNMDNLFASMAGIVTKIAFYVGALIAVSGIFSLIVAYKDDNGATRSAVKSCSVC